MQQTVLMIKGKEIRRNVLGKGCVVVFFLLLSSCQISLKQYAEAEKNLEDCVDGVRAPADEFCSKDSHIWTKAQEDMELRLENMKEKNYKKYEKWQKEVSRVNVRWYDFLEAFDK